MTATTTAHREPTGQEPPVERVSTLVIGAGQAGLAVGYELARRGQPFVIVDGAERVGDAWRQRWASLRLFTPARYDGLPGRPFPGPPHGFPTKDAMADYLEAYARALDLPVRLGVRVERLTREGERFVAQVGPGRIVADQVIVGMSGYQVPHVPAFAGQLAADVVQLHSHAYRDAAQLRSGAVLVVGAGNSGAEIALEVVKAHPTTLAGTGTGHLPLRIGEAGIQRLVARLVLRGVMHRVLTTDTPMGRAARPRFQTRGGPWIRVKPRDLTAAGVVRAPRVTGVVGGAAVLADGRRLEVANVIWCTGFRPGLGWIDLPVFGPDGLPRHRRGVAVDVPGLAFVGLPFLYAASSTMVHGVPRDAAHVVAALASRAFDASGRAARGGTGAAALPRSDARMLRRR